MNDSTRSGLFTEANIPNDFQSALQQLQREAQNTISLLAFINKEAIVAAESQEAMFAIKSKERCERHDNSKQTAFSIITRRKLLFQSCDYLASLITTSDERLSSIFEVKALFIDGYISFFKSFT